MSFVGDVLLFNTHDSGEIEFVNGQPLMTAGFETAVFLSLFGGNFADDGLAGNKKTWWANLNEDDPDFKYISRFQNLTHSGIPLTTFNLRRLEDAASADLEWFKTTGIATEIRVVASIPKLNTLRLFVAIKAVYSDDFENAYLINWKSYL